MNMDCVFFLPVGCSVALHMAHEGDKPMEWWGMAGVWIKAVVVGMGKSRLWFSVLVYSFTW